MAFPITIQEMGMIHEPVTKFILLFFFFSESNKTDFSRLRNLNQLVWIENVWFCVCERVLWIWSKKIMSTIIQLIQFPYSSCLVLHVCGVCLAIPSTPKSSALALYNRTTTKCLGKNKHIGISLLLSFSFVIFFSTSD